MRAGEILGIAGVSGNGQNELLTRCPAREPVADAGGDRRLRHCLSGRDLPAERRDLGMGFVPEERLGRGAVPRMSLTENALLTASSAGMVMLKNGMIQFKIAIAEFARGCIDTFNVVRLHRITPPRALSGGNLQKFIMGREILLAPRLLVVAQPTWGVDVGAAAFIRQELIDLRNEGTAILVISEELEELFEISDRIAVIANGRTVAGEEARPTPISTKSASG